MSKPRFITFIGFSFLATCLFFILNISLHYISSQKAENILLENLKSAGFSYIEFKRKISHNNDLIFKNISLDTDGFSTIESIHVTYHPWRILYGDFIKNITFKNMNLTGEVSLLQPPYIIISGLTHKDRFLLPSYNIEFQNLNIDLLIPSLGGMNIKSDIKVYNNVLEGRVITKQKKLSFEGELSGNISSSGLIAAELDILSGFIDLAEIKMKRVSGKISAQGSALQQLHIQTNINGGYSNLWGLDWQSISASHNSIPLIYKKETPDNSDYAAKALEVFLSAKTQSPYHLELSANVIKNKEAYIQDKQNLFPFLYDLHLYSKEDIDLVEILSEQNLVIKSSKNKNKHILQNGISLEKQTAPKDSHIQPNATLDYSGQVPVNSSHDFSNAVIYLIYAQRQNIGTLTYYKQRSED